MTPREIYRQAYDLTTDLIATNLSVAQNPPTLQRSRGGVENVAFASAAPYDLILKGVPYPKIYAELERNNLYNFKLIDGALIQLLYRFKNRELIAHRVGFFPAPQFSAYDEDPELYEEDDLYADIIEEGLVRFPVRFDYNADDAVHQDVTHPKVHLTLGQYPNCRIPVSSPMSPRHFVSFILRNFYYSALQKVGGQIDLQCEGLAASITRNEKKTTYLAIPVGA